MAVDTTQSWQEHTSDGSTAYFPFNFNYDTTRPGTIVVGKRTADNTYSVVDASNYELIPNASGDGGQIRFIQNPSGSQVIDDIPPAGTIVRIERVSVDTSSATWQIGLEMSELVNLFDRLFRLVQENKGGFDNVIKTFETQHNVSLYELLSAHNNHLLYWDNTTQTLTPTDFPKEDVVRCVNGLFFRISTTQAGIPYLEWSVNGSSDWHSSSATWGTIGGNINNQTDLKNALDAKQNTISDLATIRSGAAKGATAVQPNDNITVLNNNAGYITGISSSMVITALGYTPVNPSNLATVATSGSYNDLSDKPTIPTTLAGLTGDVSISSPTNGQSLQYDASLNKWKNVSSTVSIGFDGITGSPEDNVALKNALDLKADNNAVVHLMGTETIAGNKTFSGTNYFTGTTNVPTPSNPNESSTHAANTQWVHDFAYSYVSNCITEIPQDIKLELNNGTLTLKSGSIVTAPDGTQYTATTDNTTPTYSSSDNGKGVIFCSKYNQYLQGFVSLNRVGSGTTLPEDATNYSVFYNSTDNKIYLWQNNSWNKWDVCLPLAIVSVESGVITSIDQVFNGFGYIGTTAFVLPGVQALLAKGKNTNGTLKSQVWTNSSVKIVDISTGAYVLYQEYNNTVGRTSSIYEVNSYNDIPKPFSDWVRWYVRDENLWYASYAGSITNATQIPFVNYKITNGVVSEFNVLKQPFRAVDYNDYAQTQSQVSTNTSDIATNTNNIATNASDIAAIIANTKSITAKDTINSILTTTGINKAQSGYVKLGNGLIIQWLNNQLIAQNTAITLPTAFTSATSYSAIAVHVGTTETSYPYTTREQTSTTVSFNRYTGMGGDERANIIAIGY